MVSLGNMGVNQFFGEMPARRVTSGGTSRPDRHGRKGEGGLLFAMQRRAVDRFPGGVSGSGAAAELVDALQQGRDAERPVHAGDMAGGGVGVEAGGGDP